MKLVKGPTYTLENLPIGLFQMGNTLALKTEYRTEKGAIEAFIVSSGEFFWGGAKTQLEQTELLVTQIDVDMTDHASELVDGVPYIPYPVALHTVDIIATRNNSNGIEILLGQKGKEQDKTKWVFIGGFVDPTNTAESAALRELHEETNVEVTDEDRLIYIGSLFVDDGRFKDSPHKVTTSIFTLELTDEEAAQAVGGDDIQEVKWVALDDVLPLLKEHHIPLYHKFLTSKNKWVNLHHL